MKVLMKNLPSNNKITMRDLQKIIQSQDMEKSRHFLQYTSFKSAKQVFQILQWVEEFGKVELLAPVIDSHKNLLLSSRDETQLRILADCSRKLRRDVEAYEYTYQRAQLYPHKIQNWLPFLQSIYQTRDYWWSIEIAEDALHFHSHSKEIWDILLHSLFYIKSSRLQETLQKYQTLFSDPHSLRISVEYTIIFDCAKAQSLLHNSLKNHPDSLHLHIAKAHFSLWNSDLFQAQKIAEKILLQIHSPNNNLDLDNDSDDIEREAKLICIAVHMLKGNLNDAHKKIHSLLTKFPNDAQGLLWESEYCLLQKNYEKASHLIATAIEHQEHYCFISQIIRHICLESLSLANGHLPWKMQDLEIFPHLKILGIQGEEPASNLMKIREHFSGNRHRVLTYLQDNSLIYVQLPLPPRHIGRMMQHILFTRGMNAAIKQAKYEYQQNPVPLFIIYLGELYLWTGQYQEAADCFEQSISLDKNTKWAWIGLGACHMLEGNLQKALQTWKRGLDIVHFAGPTLYAYRGECYRLLGETQKAYADIRHAIQEKPNRLSAHFNLALLNCESFPEKTHQYVKDLKKEKPFFVQDIQQKEKMPPNEFLQKALLSMRGNRSSTFYTYFVNDKIRFV
jgi:tetratricopeptide (TPR) repeat protein